MVLRTAPSGNSNQRVSIAVLLDLMENRVRENAGRPDSLCAPDSLEAAREGVAMTQSLRRYAAGIVIGAVLMVAVYGAISVSMPYRRELRIQREIEAYGGRALFLYCGPSWVPPFIQNRLPWYDRILIVDLPFHILSEENPPRSSRNELISELGSLSYLEQLDLNGTVIDDAGLKQLSPLARLDSLKLRSTHITDVGLVHLKGMPKLDTLNLASTRITDAGLLHLKGITSLGHLAADDTEIGDAGLQHLNGLTGMRALWLSNTRITDAGLVHLKGMAKLRCLCVEETEIGDAGLQHLSGLTNLQLLILSKTSITDAGLIHLKGLTRLNTLELSGTQTTEQGREMLQKALPKCTISK